MLYPGIVSISCRWHAIFPTDIINKPVSSPVFDVKRWICKYIVCLKCLVKFCGWAKKFELSGGFKKTIFILTAVGLVGFNVLYSMGNAAIKAGNGWGTASIALLAALIWAFVFAFALMAETK